MDLWPGPLCWAPEPPRFGGVLRRTPILQGTTRTPAPGGSRVFPGVVPGVAWPGGLGRRFPWGARARFERSSGPVPPIGPGRSPVASAGGVAPRSALPVRPRGGEPSRAFRCGTRPRSAGTFSCFFLSFCRPCGVIMTSMKTRPEPRRRVDDARAQMNHEPSPADTNLAFLRALADALRDILRDERGHVS
jgi:hypothetical protein